MHRIDGPGATVDNKFTEGNPATATPATTVTDDWLNDVQEELISILAAAGITPVKGTQNQVLAAILAVARRKNALTFSGNQTLTPADAGSCYIYAEPSDVTITLPSLAATPAGAVFEFINTGPNNLTITRAGSDQIDAGLSTVNSIVILPNRSLTIVRANASLLWHAVTAPVAVQSMLGNLQAAETFSGALTAAVADAGKAYIYSGGGGHTANLPLVADVPSGSSYEFINTGTGNLTVSCGGSDLIDVGPSTTASITVPAGQSLRLVRASGSSNWHAVTFPAASLAGAFGSQLSANGWHRWPSGLIMQWGVIPGMAANASSLVSYPIAFPNTAIGFSLAGGATAAGVPGVNIQSVSASQARFWNQSASLATSAGGYIVFGY